MTASIDEYLTPEELADRYKGIITTKTLANWRSAGIGPAYTRVGGRILYAVCDVLHWESTRRQECASCKSGRI
jgi:hypothetical protein